MELREKIADLITNELFDRFGSPSSAVIGVQLADRILASLRDGGYLKDETVAERLNRAYPLGHSINVSGSDQP